MITPPISPAVYRRAWLLAAVIVIGMSVLKS
jgi:hypothetical protein